MAKSKVTLTPAQVSEKWGRRMKSAIGDIQAGIDSVSESPMERAANAQEKMKQNLNRAIDNGRWQAGLRKVTLQDWKAKTKDKVATRLSGGVDAAMPKRRDFDNYMVQTINAKLPEIQQMPNMTLEDSFNRVRAMMEHMHNNPYKK